MSWCLMERTTEAKCRRQLWVASVLHQAPRAICCFLYNSCDAYITIITAYLLNIYTCIRLIDMKNLIVLVHDVRLKIIIKLLCRQIDLTWCSWLRQFLGFVSNGGLVLCLFRRLTVRLATPFFFPSKQTFFLLSKADL